MIARGQTGIGVIGGGDILLCIDDEPDNADRIVAGVGSRARYIAPAFQAEKEGIGGILAGKVSDEVMGAEFMEQREPFRGQMDFKEAGCFGAAAGSVCEGVNGFSVCAHGDAARFAKSGYLLVKGSVFGECDGIEG